MNLKTKHIDFLFDEKFRLTGIETPAGRILPQSDPQPFIYAVAHDGNRHNPVCTMCNEDKLEITLDDGGKLLFNTDETDDGLIITLMGEPPYKSVTIADFTPEPYKSETDYAVCGFGMTMNINARSYPTHKRSRISAEAVAGIGFNGASFAIVCAPRDSIRYSLKKLSLSTGIENIPFNLKGGAFALDCRDNFSNYYIITDKPIPSEIVEQGVKYKNYGIDQLDFHQGSVYIQGSMRFNETDYPDGANDFCRLVSEPLAKAGVITGLHTYAFYIARNCHEMTADPGVQSQLVDLGVFTLSADAGADDVLLLSDDDLSGISPDTGFFEKTSKYILVDTEIIEFTTTANGFTGCKRGSCGTAPASHAKGSKIKHLANMFFMFTPIPGSELFYRIAQNTAKAYNEGGFNMIYLDALDGLASFDEQGFAWYYAAAFVAEILKYCVRPPLIEYSTMYPSIWSARSRMGAWDVGIAGHKRYLSLHAASNEEYCDAVFLPSQLGWYTFHPAALMGDTFANAQVKTLYEDDIDYLGRLGIAYNSGFSFMGVGDVLIERFPVIKKNIDTFLKYDSLKKKNIVPFEIREKLKNGEYKLDSSDGGYSFTEKRYVKTKINTADNFSIFNPFDAQKPFIRIEALYTAADGEPITLAHFDENIALDSQPDTFIYSNHINLNEKKALRLQVYSENKDGVLCIQLHSPTYRASGGADFYIPLDFSGWRDFILLETDNGDYSPEEFGRIKEHHYEMHFNRVYYDEISQLKLFKKGDCSGIRLSNIKAHPYEAFVLKNPVIYTNNACVMFEGEMKSSEYLEYTFDGYTARIYDDAGHSRTITVKTSGEFICKSGINTISLTSENGHVRAAVTIGFDGEVYHEKYVV
ncbi:MAG: hypothetical protein ACYCWE_16960 [Eubacteriales bacterium]